MRLVDTHCHLDLKQYDKDAAEVIKRAVDSGVERMIVPGISLESSIKAIELAHNYDSVFAAAGIHPHEADKVAPEDIDKLRSIATVSEKVVAIGEVGLDHYKGYSDHGAQKKLFSDCVDLAKELDLPLIIHNRTAEKELLEVLKTPGCTTLRGVVHCFSGDKAFLSEVLSMDLFVSFAGNITFEKAADSREMAGHVPLDRLLLETDSPYITPAPNRGKRNEPSYVKYLLKVYSEIYGITAEEVAEATTRNADKLFRLGLFKKSTVAYEIRGSLYLNLTYRCTNRCTFCTRDISDHVKGYDLKLDKEPTYDELVKAIGDPSLYNEIVFCGLGEPTLRLEAIKRVGRYVQDNGGKVRLTTNGEGDLINGRRIAPEIKGIVDRISVSLNAPDSATYDHICRSVFGGEAYGKILDFIGDCVSQGIQVEITCLDIVGEKGIEDCKRIAEERGASFRLRYLNAVG